MWNAFLHGSAACIGTEPMEQTKFENEGTHAKIDSRLARLSLTALGVVFGDIATSPIYAIRECFHGE